MILYTSASHAAEVCASFTQGTAYFASAKTADRAVRPLLLYYGVLSLARGAAIFLRRGRREASLSQAHGLMTVAWGETLSQPDFDIGNLRVRVTKSGSLQEFADATGNRTLLRLGQNTINQVLVHDPFMAGQEFTLADILSRLPELMEQHARWRPDGRCAIGGVEKNSATGSVAITLKKRTGTLEVDRSRVDRIVETFQIASVQETQDNWLVALRFTADTIADVRSIPGIWDYVPKNQLGIGSLCLVGRYPGGWFGSKPVALFSLSYILGMLARYFPSRWMSLARNYGNDGGAPTLLSAMTTIEEQVPRMLADFLERTDVEPTQ